MGHLRWPTPARVRGHPTGRQHVWVGLIPHRLSRAPITSGHARPPHVQPAPGPPPHLVPHQRRGLRAARATQRSRRLGEPRAGTAVGTTEASAVRLVHAPGRPRRGFRCITPAPAGAARRCPGHPACAKAGRPNKRRRTVGRRSAPRSGCPRDPTTRTGTPSTCCAPAERRESGPVLDVDLAPATAPYR